MCGVELCHSLGIRHAIGSQKKLAWTQAERSVAIVIARSALQKSAAFFFRARFGLNPALNSLV